MPRSTCDQLSSMQRDLMEQIEDDDVEDEEIFKEVPAVLEKTEADQVASDRKRSWPDGVPRKRLRQKGPMPAPEGMELDDEPYTPSVMAPNEDAIPLPPDKALWTTQKRTPKTMASFFEMDVVRCGVPW